MMRLRKIDENSLTWRERLCYLSDMLSTLDIPPGKGFPVMFLHKVSLFARCEQCDAELLFRKEFFF